MKTTLLTLSIVSAGTLSLAQASFGIRAGGNANYIGVPDADSKTRSELDTFAGFHAGTYMMLPLSERLFFSPELQYIPKGLDSQEGP